MVHVLLLQSTCSQLSDCTSDIVDWARSNRLMLNPDKSETIWCTTSQRQHQLSTAAILIVGIPNSQSPCRGLSVISDLYWYRLVIAGACQTNGVAVLRCSPAIVPAPPSGADSHILDARSGSGTLRTQLWQCYTGRHSSLPGMPFAVGAQRGGTTHLPSATTRSHLWCVGDTALAARPRMRAV